MDNELLKKLGLTAADITQKSKWEKLLESKDPPIQIFTVAHQMLLKSEGYAIFKELLYSKNDIVSQNCMHLLIQFCNHSQILNYIKSKGFERLLEACKNADEVKKVRIVQFFANLVEKDVSLHNKAITQGLFLLGLKLLSSTNINLSSLALQITYKLAPGPTNQDLNIYSNKENIEVMVSLLQSPDEDVLSRIIPMLANLLTLDETRKTFSQLNGIYIIVTMLKSPAIFSNHKEAMLTVLANIYRGEEEALIAHELGATDFYFTNIQTTDPNLLVAVLGGLINLSLHERIIDDILLNIKETRFLDSLLKLLSTNHSEVKIRSAMCISNLMVHESVQPFLFKSRAIKTMMHYIITDSDISLKTRLLKAIFHLTMHNDRMREKVTEEVFSDLCLLMTEQIPLASKIEVIKALSNLTLYDTKIFSGNKVVSQLLFILGSSAFSEVHEVTSIALENLATDTAINAELEKYGGFETSIDFLKSSQNDPILKERSLALVSRFAINGKMRKKYQQNDTLKLLNSIDTPARDLKQLAITMVNTPTFDNDDSIIIEDEFPEYANYNFEDSDDDANPSPRISDKEKTSPRDAVSRFKINSSPKFQFPQHSPRSNKLPARDAMSPRTPPTISLTSTPVVPRPTSP